MTRTSTKLSFPGSLGEELAARLDLPDGQPKAFALFAHCFTCSKDVFAASRIAGELSDLGFAVLRFDFTGLGASDGEFSNTNFSSNVADLVAAADYLRANHSAPQIMIGHSLGGAAVLAAAGEVPEVRAVATIGAPADTEHVVHNFGAKIDEIEREGLAEVSLAGRPFTIHKQFLDDVRAQSLHDRIAGLRRAVLVMHAPLDDVVGIENAGEIFKAAKHPKSFISLDGADHLLTRRQDAAYAARMLAAWAGRFIDAQESAGDGDTGGHHVLPTPGPAGLLRVAETRTGKFQQDVVVGPHRLIADEPQSFGGDDTGPTPYDFLSAALGTCTSMTLRMYADRKKWPLERVRVDVSHAKVHADDCLECAEGREGRIDRFERRIAIEGDLDAEQRAKLIEIADKCPVHKTLEQSSVIATVSADPQ